MKTTLITILLSLFLIGCYQPEKERALRELERSQKKLTGYHEMVGALTWKLKKLQRQWEQAENILVHTIKEFRIHPTKQESAERIYRAVANKEEIERNMEKTILTINHLTDSVLATQAKIRDAKAVLNDYEYLTMD